MKKEMYAVMVAVVGLPFFIMHALKMENVCPSHEMLQIEGYIPSVVGPTMASSIIITAKNQYDVVMRGPIHYAHSKTFSEIKKNVENNELLTENKKSYFDPQSKTLYCAYKIGEDEVLLKNEKEAIIYCSALKNYKVHHPKRFFELDLFEKMNTFIPQKKFALFKKLSNGIQSNAIFEDVMNDEALIMRDERDSYVVKKMPIKYSYELTLGDFSGYLLSPLFDIEKIEKELSSFSLREMKCSQKENKHSVITCVYENKTTNEMVTTTMEYPAQCSYMGGDATKESIFLCKQMFHE